MSATMATNALLRELANYASYHRDPRNILTHFFGVPLIVVSFQLILVHLGFHIAGQFVSAMWLAILLSCAYYLRLEWRMGAVMTILLVGSGALVQQFATFSLSTCLMVGGAIFVFGWILQFIGHYFEGRKPAFVDDLIGFMIGPIFVTAELLFLCGLRRELESDITAIAGPTRKRVF